MAFIIHTVPEYLYFTAQNVESDELFESNKTQMSIFSKLGFSSRCCTRSSYKLLPVPYPPR